MDWNKTQYPPIWGIFLNLNHVVRNFMDGWIQNLQTYFLFDGINEKILINLVFSGLIVLCLWLLRWWFISLVNARVADPKVRYSWRKGSTYIFFTLSVLFVGALWIDDVGPLTTYLGLLSAGLAIALRDPLTNLVAWMFIISRRPFSVGDRVQIGDFAGDVVDLRVFQFSLMEIGKWTENEQSTGRVIHVPNGQVFTMPLANYTRGFEYIWNEIPITVTFESDWAKARSILQKIADQHDADVNPETIEKAKKISEDYLIFYEHLTPIVYTSLEENGVTLSVRYICEPRQRRTSTRSGPRSPGRAER
jgi:small-conductance mechanosensitive channel